MSKYNRDRWIGAAIVPTEGADEYAVAELKNDCDIQWLHRGSRRVGHERAILGLKESAATALKLAGVHEESALCDSQSNGLAERAL